MNEEAGVASASEATVKESKVVVRRTVPKWESDALDRVKGTLKKSQKALSDLVQRDVNEADTRLFVTDILCDALGYDKYTELSTEYRVKTEFADYGLRLDGDLVAFLEVKRVNTKLGTKHLRQVQSYAVNEGIEWLILTNGSQWQVYHLSGGLPIITDLAIEIDLLGDSSPLQKASALFYLTKESFKKGKISELWQAKRATSPKSLTKVLLSDNVVAAVKKELKKTTGYILASDEIMRLVRDTCLKMDCMEK